MTQAPAQHPRRYWIFQARREHYDLEKRLVPGEQEEWELNQYRDSVRPGDVVLLWNTGDSGNLWGWGHVQALGVSTFTRKGEKPTESATVHYEAKFGEPMSRAGLARQPLLEALTILRAPTATNFRVTWLEARRLVELMREAGEDAPPEPERFGRGSYPYAALQELRFAEEVDELVTGLGVEFEPGGIVVLPELVRSSLRVGLTSRLIEKVLRRTKNEVLSLKARPMLERLANDAETWNRVGLDDGCLEAFELARRVAIATTRSETIGIRHLIGALLVLPRWSTATAEAMRVNAELANLGLRPDNFRNAIFSALEKESGDPNTEAWRTLGRGLGPRGDGTSRPEPQSEPSSKKRMPAPSKGGPSSDVTLEAAGSAPGPGLGERAGSVGGTGESAGTMPPPEPPPEPTPQPSPSPEAPPPSASEPASEGLLLGLPILSDRPGAEDFLELADEHKAFARLLADPDTKLPLAIGLFGHWGAGKTTFLDNLDAVIGSENPQNSGVGFHVAQIRFNAWHYMEADVWASLADHLFRSLDQEVRAKRAQREKLTELIDELESASRLESRLQRQLSEVEHQIDDTASKLAEARIEANEKKGTFEGKWQAFLDEAGSKATQESFLGVVRDAEAFFGSDQLSRIRGELGKANNSFNQLRGEMNRVREFAASLNKPRIPELLSRYWWLLALIVGAGVVLFFVVREWGQGLAGALGGVTAIGGSLLARAPMVKRWIDRGTKLRDEVSQFLERLDQAQKTAMLADPELVGLSAEHERADRARDGLVSDLQRCKDRKRELEEQLTEKPVEERVLEFIKTRAETTDYNKRLGTLAIVRRDFEKLSELLHEQYESGEARGLPSIRRIVLYIDDLDRCPWNRVMSVLEAVHLLLAFPLFAVVIAVDARWVRRSVTQHLERMGRDNRPKDRSGGESDSGESDGGGSGDGASGDGSPDADAPAVDQAALGGRATPQEYLEKIIQVPFWLKPLEDGQRADLLRSMLKLQPTLAAAEALTLEAPELAAPELTTPAGEGPAAGSNVGDTPAAVQSAPGVEEAAEQSVEESGTAAVTPNVEPAVAAAADKQTSASAPVGDTKFELPEAWKEFRPRQLTPGEIGFFRVLDSLLGQTPRSVKRYLSLYGICRAFRPETEDVAFSGEHGEHRGVQLIYAVQTGWPEVAFPFFRLLVRHSDYTDFFELVETLRSQYDAEGQVPGSEPRPAEFDGVSGKTWDRFFAALADAKREFDKLPDASSNPIEINPMLGWLPFVTRFAFEDWSASRHAF